MKNLFYSIILFTASCSLQDNSSHQPPAPEVPVLTDFNGCFLMKIDVDSATMDLKLNDTSGFYEGKMAYRPKTTNPHNGTIALKQDSFYIKGWYTSVNFEGRKTVSEKIFRPVSNGLTEGVGDMEERNDSAFYKYPNNLRFEDNFPFRKIPCN